MLARVSRLKENIAEPDVWDLLNLQSILQDAMDLARRRDELTESGFRRRITELEHEFEMWLVLDDRHRHPEIAKLCRHLQKNRDELLMFLYDPLVPPTNNHAERMIRPAVITRKLGGCNKTVAGARVHSVLASLLASCRQQGKRFLDLASQLFHSPMPRAISLATRPDG